MQSRLREIYEKNIVPELVKEFGYKNVFAVPKLSKIVLNMGVGEAVSDKKKLDSAAADLTAIAAQKSIITHAKKSMDLIFLPIILHVCKLSCFSNVQLFVTQRVGHY